MPALPTALPPGGAFATPHEGRRFTVPALGRGFQGIDDLLRRFGRLPSQGSTHDNALDGFGHVQPGTTQGRIQRHDPMFNEPQNHIRCMVTGQIIPDQQHAQRWQGGGQGQGLPQAVLPDLPQGGLRRRITSGWGWQSGQNRRTLRLEPGMQDRIGGAGHPLDPHGTGARMKQGQHFRRAIADVLVRLADGLPTGLPTGARIGLGLVRPRFILIPDRQAQLFAQRIGVFNQFFFASVSGSTTVTAPRLR